MCCELQKRNGYRLYVTSFTIPDKGIKKRIVAGKCLNHAFITLIARKWVKFTFAS